MEGFLFYASFFDAIRLLPSAEMRDQAYRAICEYALNGEEPEELEPMVEMVFVLAKPQIDANTRRRINGGKGGRKPLVSETGNHRLSEEETDGYETEKPKEKEKDKEKEKVKENIKDTLSGKPTPEYPYKEVIDYLNAKTGKHFLDKSKDNKKHIKARFDEGRSLDDFYKVIDNMTAKWKGDPKMDDFLRPATLFGPKFESYLNVKVISAEQGTKFSNFPERDNDYSALENLMMQSAVGGDA